MESLFGINFQETNASKSDEGVDTIQGTKDVSSSTQGTRDIAASAFATQESTYVSLVPLAQDILKLCVEVMQSIYDRDNTIIN